MRARRPRAAPRKIPTGTLATVVLASAWLPHGARAYTFASPISDGCHERLTLGALDALRGRHDVAPPLAASADERVWIDDLPFDFPSHHHELVAASLLVGVRDNDLRGASALDISEIAVVHGDPARQSEHCLRSPGDDGPRGDERALAACRTFIRDRAQRAIREGLDGRGEVDPAQYAEVNVHLDFAGERRIAMPLAYLVLGQALHALQDSFSHTVRSQDGMRVRTLLNWVDVAQGDHELRRDGPAHRSALDECTDLGRVRTIRFQRAAQASLDLLEAALAGDADPDSRLAEVDAVLDRYLVLQPGCDPDNAYCDAPELGFPTSALSCQARSGAGARRGPVVWLAWLAWLVLAWCGRRCWRVRTRGLLVRAGLLCLGLWVVPARGAASSPAARASSPQATTEGATESTPRAGQLAVHGSLSGAIDQAGAALAAGGRYALTPSWLLGLDAEWNPWLSLETGRARSGSFNSYLTVVYRAPLGAGLALRVTGHAGLATLLFDVYGAPAGSVGPYFGLSLLALELRVARALLLVLDPADVVVAMPQLSGIPYMRRQYRATVRLELWL